MMTPRPIRQFAVCAWALLVLTGCHSPPTVIVDREPVRGVESVSSPRWPLPREFTVAVMPFARADDPLEPDFGRIQKDSEREIRRRFERELLRVPGVRVFDRAHLDQIVRTLGYQASPIFDESTPQKLGRLAKADAALFGTVQSCAVAPHRIGPYSARLDVADVEFTVTLADLATGRILWKATHRGSARRFLPRPREEFLLDFAGPSVYETRAQSKAALADLERLADQLTRETVAAFAAAR